MDRRQFSAQAAWALLGGALITIGCGRDAANPNAATPPPNDVTGRVDPNHGHVAVITAAQFLAGGGLELDIRGTATHSHMVTLSGAEVTAIRWGTAMTKTSSGSSHTHSVIFNA